MKPKLSSIDNVMSNPANWDAPLQSGDDLVFPATAVRFTVANDLPAGTQFGSITIASSGYDLVGIAAQRVSAPNAPDGASAFAQSYATCDASPRTGLDGSATLRILKEGWDVGRSSQSHRSWR